ncbi:MAG: metal-sensing transcriptional repressor [Bacillus subtilis]|nr:metal-sensing transcriptional repressor [Bacillus subtilis]
MVEEDRYCIDVSTQILAADGGARESEPEQSCEAHLDSCVLDNLIRRRSEEGRRDRCPAVTK